MASDPWPGDMTPQPTEQPSSVLDDRQMIRHLASKYTASELAKLFQEEGKTTQYPADDSASIISYASSTFSEDQPSIFDSQSIRSFSDTSSIAGSVFSALSSSKVFNRKVHGSSAQASGPQTLSSSHSTDAPPSWTADVAPPREAATRSSDDPTTLASSATTPAATPGPAGTLAKPKAAYLCGFCKEEGIIKTCTRKNDLKRHIEDFHKMDAQWMCRHRGCRKVFDWQTAFKTHLKQSHGGSRMSVDEAKVNLCPQVVFACGFQNCSQVFEAPSDHEAGQTFKDYVAHVVKHFDDGAKSGEWTYSARMQNLLRQSRVIRAWEDCGWPASAKSQLEWQPQTSGILRKRLECRHIGDVKLLVMYALELGNGANQPPKFREDFVTPIRNSCPEHSPGHSVQGHMHDATSTPEPSDPFTFRISRNANPELAAYLASQRRIYVPRPGHRSSRPSQHPAHSLSPRGSVTSAAASHSLGMPMSTSAPHMGNGHMSNHHYFPPTMEHSSPNSPLFNHSSQSSYGSSGPSMLHHSHTNHMADDLNSMRSMANASPEPDVDMGGTSMIPTSFSSAYSTDVQGAGAPNGLGNSMGMSHDPFYTHGGPQHHAGHQQAY